MNLKNTSVTHPGRIVQKEGTSCIFINPTYSVKVIVSLNDIPGLFISENEVSNWSTEVYPSYYAVQEGTVRGTVS